MRNNELLKLKLCAGKIMQKLNYYKKKVAEMTSEQQSLNTEFELRSKLMDKVEKETEMVIKEKTKAEVTNHMIRNQLEEYSVPDVS
jgi:regulator of replication initiation timing